MYRCDVCDETTQPGEKVHRIPDGFRVRRYCWRRGVNVAHLPYKKKPVLRDDPGGFGYEWKGMQRACGSCFAEFVEEDREQQLAAVQARVDARESSVMAAK